MNNKIDCGCEKDVFACRLHVHGDQARHTEGPWQVTGVTIETVSGEFIATTSQGYLNGKGIQNARDNAHLIAAAPELLAALKLLLPVAQGQWRGTTDGEPKLLLAEKAIAKAEGLDK